MLRRERAEAQLDSEREKNSAQVADLTRALSHLATSGGGAENLAVGAGAGAGAGAARGPAVPPRAPEPPRRSVHWRGQGTGLHIGANRQFTTRSATRLRGVFDAVDRNGDGVVNRRELLLAYATRRCR